MQEKFKDVVSKLNINYEKRLEEALTKISNDIDEDIFELVSKPKLKLYIYSHFYSP